MTEPLALFHFAQHRLQSLFELAAKLRAGDQRAHVQRDDTFVLQTLGHVALDDSQGQPFGDRGLADARFADQHGIVLRAARQDLNRRVESPCRGRSPDRACPAFARSTRSMPYCSSAWNLSSGFWSVTRAVPRTDLQRLQDILFAHAVQLQQALGGRLDLGQRQQQMFGRDEFILHPIGFSLGALQDLLQALPDWRTAPRPRLSEVAATSESDRAISAGRS